MSISFFLKKSAEDISANRLLHFTTVAMTGLILLILAAFLLVVTNVNQIGESWQNGIRVTAYVKKGTDENRIGALLKRIRGLHGINRVVFVTADEALTRLRTQMGDQSGVLDSLHKNPLPPSFEVSLNPDSRNEQVIRKLADRISGFEGIEDVQYGQAWIERFLRFFNLFKITGVIMGALLLVITVFIISNTIKLTIYARRDELEIMQLVGATERFIKIPFYIQGVLQGLAGALISLGVLYALFTVFISRTRLADLTLMEFHVKFLSSELSGMLILLGILAGWFGGYVSLKKFLKISG